MAATKEDLCNFVRFADEKLQAGAAASITDLAREWESQCCNTAESAEYSIEMPLVIDASVLERLAEAFPEVPDDVLKQRLGKDRGGVTTEQLLANARAAAAMADQK